MIETSSKQQIQFVMQLLENMWFAMPGTCLRFYQARQRMDVEIKMKRVTGHRMVGEQVLNGTVCYSVPIAHGETRDHGEREAYKKNDLVQVMFNSRSTEFLYDDLVQKKRPKFKRICHENDAVVIGGHTVEHTKAWPGGPQSAAPPNMKDDKIIWYSKIPGQPWFYRITPDGLHEILARMWHFTGDTFRTDAYTILGGGGPRVHRIGDIDSDGDIAVTAATNTEAG